MTIEPERSGRTYTVQHDLASVTQTTSGPASVCLLLCGVNTFPFLTLNIAQAGK